MEKADKLKNAFNSIYQAEADAIFRFCFARVSNREQALDLTQETFVRLWQTISEGKSMSNTRAFLFTIAHNLIIDWYRKKKPVAMPEEHDVSDGATDLDRELKAEGRFLLGKIRELSEAYREAVHLRFVEGLLPAEIGEILGLSANVVSVRINRGIEELRQKYER